MIFITLINITDSFSVIMSATVVIFWPVLYGFKILYSHYSVYLCHGLLACSPWTQESQQMGSESKKKGNIKIPIFLDFFFHVLRPKGKPQPRFKILLLSNCHVIRTRCTNLSSFGWSSAASEAASKTDSSHGGRLVCCYYYCCTSWWTSPHCRCRWTAPCWSFDPWWKFIHFQGAEVIC